MRNLHWLTGGLLAIPSMLCGAELVNDAFEVTLNPEFPGLVSYRYAGNQVALPQSESAEVLLNGTAYQPKVTLTTEGKASATYLLSFEELGVTMEARVTVERKALRVRIVNVQETGDFTVRTIEIPSLVLLAGQATDEAAIANFSAPSYASEKPEDHDQFGKVSEIEFTDDAKRNRNERDERGTSYVFLSNGKLAVGMHANVMEENLRMIVKFNGEGENRTLTAAPGKWTYREIPTEICPTPEVLLVVSTDQNGDDQVTWQDAAIQYRREVPQPYAAETIKETPIVHIAMNFGSQATNPFLRILDNAKKIWLFTDGLGQRIQFKGFAGEGHDSSHPDYAGNVGRRMGGREDLNYVMRRGLDFNMKSGVHINAHEYHTEAKWFTPDLVDMHAVGWAWLDESYLVDYRFDSAYGSLYERLDAMREDLPWLDFVYLDVYYGRGWPGWRMHTRTNDLGIAQFTEFPGVMERAVIWNHVANDWTQKVGGTGDRSDIARFIWYSQKDTFKHDPLLRGSNCDGFMGWHAETEMPKTIHSAFNVNLPTKYLQHFELLRTTAEGAFFRGGPHTEVSEDGAVSKVFGRDGQLVHSLRYPEPNTRPVDNLAFIPWDPIGEGKIYHWNDAGGSSSWTLPSSWKGIDEAELYRLTDTGRVFERVVKIANGEVTLDEIQANTPYVLYRTTPHDLPAIEWGEGGLVRDPGFDSHSFEAWTRVSPEGSIIFENHEKTGQTELVVPGTAAAEVRQKISKLTPGQTYAASVWTSIEGRRDTRLSVAPVAHSAATFTDKGAWHVVSSPKHTGGDRARNLIDGKPKTLWHSAEITEENDNALPHEIVLDIAEPHTLTGFIQTAREDLGNGAIKGYKAEVSSDMKSWTTVASGNFDYADGAAVTVNFDKPVVARYFRLTATSELEDRPFTSIAELDFLMDSKADAPKELAAAVHNTIDQTILINYTDQSSKYLRNWHRLKVLFTAPESGEVELVLATVEGEGKVSFDDARIVKTGVSKAPAGASKVVLFEDFENVDEGWGPFMYGWQGPMNTHFSEANPPFTDDTIQGEFSLKSRLEGAPDLLYRTVPATLKLEPGKRYTVSFDYKSDTPDVFAFAVGKDNPEMERNQEILEKVNLEDGSWEVKKFTTTFTAGEDAFIGITKLDKDKPGTIVIDNLLITQ